MELLKTFFIFSGYTINSVAVVTGSSCVEKVLTDLLSSNKADTYSVAIMAYMFAKLKNEVFYKKAVKFLDESAINEGKKIPHNDRKSIKNFSDEIHNDYSFIDSFMLTIVGLCLRNLRRGVSQE